jgi:protein O-mannosyl-transferase
MYMKYQRNRCWLSSVARQAAAENNCSLDVRTGGKTLPKMIVLLVLPAIVCVAVVVVHYPALSARAMSFDDSQYLTHNTLVKNPCWGSARRFLTEVLEPSTVGGYYQSLAMISLMLDCGLGGGDDNLMPFHRTSLMLHTANTILVIVLLYLLFGNMVIAAAVGLLFGLHPMTVETIAWVGERKTVLAAFFALWSLIFYVRYAHKNSWIAYAGCLVAYMLALMSKPTSTTLPVVMLLMDFWPLKRLSRRAVLEKIPLFALVVTSALITYISQSRTAATYLPSNYGPERIPFILCHNIIFYLYKIIRPVNLTSHYGFPNPLSLSQPMVLAGVVGTSLLIPLLIISLRWSRAAITGWLIFFVAIFPTMGVIGFTNVIASDKFAYLPSIGLLMALTGLLVRLCVGNNKHKFRPLCIVAAVVILTAASAESVATRKYLYHWQNTLSLCEHMLSLAPNAAGVYNLKGMALQSQDEPDKAVACYRETIRLDSRNVEAYINLGNIMLGRQQPEEAARYYLTALEYDPKLWMAYYNLGLAMEKQTKYDEAIKYYEQSLKINPDFYDTYRCMTRVYLFRNNYGQAEDCCRKLLEARPMEFNANNVLASILIKQDKTDQAIEQWQRVIRLDPDNIDANYNLGASMARQSKYESAGEYFNKILQVQPEHVDARTGLANVLMAQEQTALAVEQYYEILRIHPNQVDILNRLAKILATTKDKDIRDIEAALQLAHKACDLTRYNHPIALETLSIAYEADGKFDQALTVAEQGVQKAAAMNRDDLVRRIQKQVEACKKRITDHGQE